MNMLAWLMSDASAKGPPFRAEHIGSLLRPRALKDAHKALADGAIDRATYGAVLDHAVVDAIRLQEAIGLRSITDGEFRRASWFSAFFETLAGFGMTEAPFAFRDGTGARYTWPTCFAAGPIRRSGGITTGEFESIRRETTDTPKVTMPTPSAFHFFALGRHAAPHVYPDEESYWQDLIAVYQQELAALADLGATYIQLDEVPLAMLCDPAIQDQVRQMGFDPDQLIDTYVDVINQTLAGRPTGLTVGIHLCRGNFRSRWLAAGGYGPVAPRLFGDLDVDAFFLEYDSPRAGDFSPLDHIASGKTVVLGLISTKTPEREAPDDLRRRIDEASRHVPIERLCLSPQCGFASVAGGNVISDDDQRRKLDLVVRVADAVWGEA